MSSPEEKKAMKNVAQSITYDKLHDAVVDVLHLLRTGESPRDVVEGSIEILSKAIDEKGDGERS